MEEVTEDEEEEAEEGVINSSHSEEAKAANVQTSNEISKVTFGGITQVPTTNAGKMTTPNPYLSKLQDKHEVS